MSVANANCSVTAIFDSHFARRKDADRRRSAVYVPIAKQQFLQRAVRVFIAGKEESWRRIAVFFGLRSTVTVRDRTVMVS
jgi:hypothetical protein